MLKLKIIANLIGIIIYFFTRYSGRRDKKKEPSMRYWIKDNFAELITILLFNAGLMCLVLGGGLNINFEKVFPQLAEWASFTGDVAISFFVGLIIAHLFYEIYKRFIKTK